MSVLVRFVYYLRSTNHPTDTHRLEHLPMATCELCGNQYDKTFDLTMDGTTHTFDSFECAIQALAPHCAHCECRIIGHGLEKDGVFYCCSHCASKDGIEAFVDRV